MEMILEHKPMNLCAFLDNPNIDQAIVDIPFQDTDCIVPYQLIKINLYSPKDTRSSTIVMVEARRLFSTDGYSIARKLYNEKMYPNNTKLVSLSTSSSREYMLSYDIDSKAVIYYEGHPSLPKNIIRLLNGSGYRLHNGFNLVEEIKERYNEEIERLLDGKFEEYLEKFKDYKSLYVDALNNRNYVEDQLLRDENIKFKACSLDILDFQIGKTQNLHAYLDDKSIIDKYAYKYFKENTETYVYNGLLYKHATSYAYNKILKDLKKNPTDRMKLVKIIQDATNGVGKTLNITTKTGDTFKVENRILSNKEFKTVKGYNFIGIDTVSKITYGKKVLLEL